MYMYSEVIMDIFISGLVLIPIIVMVMPEWGDKLLSWSGGKLQLALFPVSIYIIFISGFGSNLLGQISVGIALTYFFYLFAAALAALKSTQTEWKSKYNANLKSDS